jgi:hypothetical protein
VSLVPKGSYLFDQASRKGEREKLTWVHMPVFLLAISTIATFCKTVIAAVMLATPIGPYSRTTNNAPIIKRGLVRRFSRSIDPW